MELKVITLNIHKGTGWQSRRSTLDLTQAQLVAAKPDIVFLQEVLAPQFQALTDDVFAHGTYGKNSIYRTHEHGNAILSQLPLTQIANLNLSMHRYESRGLLHSTLSFPDHATSIHLLCAHLGLFERGRRHQLDLIVDYINNHIPENAFIIFGGDFNDWTCYATKALRQRVGLEEAYFNFHHAHAKTFPAWSPIFKLDRFYFRGDMKVTAANRLIRKPWNQLSDHIGVEIIFELSS